MPALPSFAVPAGKPLRGLVAALMLLAAGCCATVSPLPDAIPTEDTLPSLLRLAPGLELQATLAAHGEEIYSCRRVPAGLAWVDRGSEATLVDAQRRTAGRLVAGYYELGDDGVSLVEHVQAEVGMREGALGWQLSRVARASGPRDGGSLAWVSAIRRVQTSGGLPPSSACDLDGRTLFVPYSAIYQFFRDSRSTVAMASPRPDPYGAVVPRELALPRHAQAQGRSAGTRVGQNRRGAGATPDARLVDAMAGVLGDMQAAARPKDARIGVFVPLPNR